MTVLEMTKLMSLTLRDRVPCDRAFFVSVVTIRHKGRQGYTKYTTSMELNRTLKVSLHQIKL